jgi:hypothetical protein
MLHPLNQLTRDKIHEDIIKPSDLSYKSMHTKCTEMICKGDDWCL